MRTRLIVLAALVAALILPVPSAVWAGRWSRPAGQDGPNLLTNGDFEGGGDTWPLQDGIGEVQAAEGWRAYFLDKPPSYIVRPEFCYDTDPSLKKPKPLDDGCFWARPEFRDVKKGPDTMQRVHGGVRAQKYFTYGRMHEAGLLQRVTGITPGTQLRFSAYMQTWMCNDYVEACDGGRKSQNPTQMHLKVGIDPTGGTNPFSSNVIWGSEGESFDRWAQFSVEATAAGDAVTVFTHSRPEWIDYARMNNDVYVDDAALVAVGKAESATPASAGAQPAPTSAPQPAAPVSCARWTFVDDVTIPDNMPISPKTPFIKTWRVKNSGTCAWSGSLRFIGKGNQMGGPSPVNLARVNPGQQLDVSLNLVSPAQPGDYQGTWEAYTTDGTVLGRLVVRIRVTGDAAAIAAPVAAPQVVVTKTASLTTGGLCVQAFNDRNVNGVYDANEVLVANTRFVLLAESEQVSAYTTTGFDEPYCFVDLKPGKYVVRMQPSRNYVSTTDAQVGILLAAGQTVNISCGTRLSRATVVETPVPETATFPSFPPGTIALGVGGVMAMAAAGAGGFFLYSLRK